MKSRTARLGICLLFSVLTIAGAYSQLRPQERTSPSASPAASRSQKQASGLRHELRANNTLRVHSMASNPPTTNIGLLSATQIPAGPSGSNCTGGWPSCATTGSPYPAVLGHFNDKNKNSLQVAAVVQAHRQPGTKYAISVEMPNGSGGFTATLTVPTTQPGEFDPILVGSLFGDGVDDLVMIHPPANYEVFLNNRNGTGTFASQGIITVTGALAVGGTLATDATTGCLDILLVDGSSPGNVWTVPGQTNAGVCTGTFGAATFVTLDIQLDSNNPFNTVVFGNLSAHTNGELDFASNDTSKEVHVFINNGSGTPPYKDTPLSTPDGYYDSCFNAAGDLSGHANALDLVSANCFDNYITVYVNNGDGTFQNSDTGVYYSPVFGAPTAISIADVNGDGNNDVISTNAQSSDVSILLGNGDGTIGWGGGVESPGFVTGGHPITPAVAIADPNGSGHLDLLVPDNEYSFVYLQGYGDGTFRSGNNYYGQVGNGLGNGLFPQGFTIASGDFNGDGIPDFVIGNANSGTPPAGVTVFLSNPDGSMKPGVNYAGVNSTGYLEYVAVADFNHDGILDIAATDAVNGGVQIFTGKGDGTFTAASAEIPTDSGTYTTLGIVVADFNGDGWPDIAVVNNTTTPTADVGVLLNDKTGNFPSLTNYPLSNVGTEIAAGKLVNGQMDLAVPLYEASSPVVATFLGDGTGKFGAETDASLTNSGSGVSYYNPYAVAIGDLNGDGIPDLAVTIEDQTNFNQGIALLLGKSDGTFQAPTLLLTTLEDPGPDNPLPAYVKIADMNGDGIPDLVYTNSKFGTAGILYGKGGGAFYDPVEFPAGRWAFGIAVASLNGVGSQDVVASGNSSDFSGVTVLMNTGDTGTTVSSSAPSGSIVGNAVTFTAAVSAKVKGITGPSNQGTVTFYDGGSALCSKVQLSSGQAQCSTSSLPVGSYSITAQYNGDGGQNFLPSTSSPLTQTVVKASDATSTPVGSPNPAQPKQVVTFTVAVTATNSPLPPTGIVTFYDGGNEIGTGTLNSSGQAGLKTSFSVVGLHSITAAYGGDSNFNGSTSPVYNQQIGKAGTTTTVVSSINPALPTQIVTFTATVASTVSGLQVVPTGTVTFYDGTKSIGTGTLNSSQQATLPVSGLALGSHSITAQYLGDSNFTDSTSSALKQVVAQVSTTTSLASSVNPAPVKQSVTFTATVAASVNGLPVIPTGTVIFKDGSTQIGTGTLSSATAQFSTSSLAAGTHSITAIYGGDTNFTGSTSSAVKEVVAVPDYTLLSNPASQTVTAGSLAKFTITLTPSTGYDGQVTFACPSSLPTGVACSFLPNPLTSTGTGAVTSVLTITTTAPSAAMIVPADVNAIHGNLNLLASLSAVGLMGVVLTGDWKKRKLSGRFILLAVIALVMVLAWAGCGGGGGSSTTPPPPTGGTPSGSYPLQLTGTGTAGTNGGSTSPQQLNITLVVQ